ncbi:iqgap- protein [Sorochytrium milnesiophthora]
MSSSPLRPSSPSSSSHNIAGERVPGTQGRLRVEKEGQGSQNWMDESRKDLQAYEYLCHIGEAKHWIEDCIQEELPPITQLDEGLRNGVALAKLARAFEPELVKKIFEARLWPHADPKLQFRHSDNINYCFAFMKKVGLPEPFRFELTDLYDMKNIPKVIYGIHALSHLLAKKGIAPKIKNLVGQLDFTNEELENMQQNLDAAGITLPAFGNVDKQLDKELAPSAPQLTEEERRAQQLNEKVDSIVACQALARGWLARKSFAATVAARRAAVPGIIKAQAHWRAHRDRRAYQARLAALHKFGANVVPLQSAIRGFLARKKFATKRNFYRHNVDSIVTIQSWLKSKRASNAYEALVKLDNPPVSVVRNFVHLLDHGRRDFEEEIEIDSLKEKVVKQIRENSSLEQHLNELDVKIALLIKNRVSLDEVVKVHRKIRKYQEASAMQQTAAAASVFTLNLKSLDKNSREKLECYQSMFYLLQTSPIYLTRLLCLMRDWSAEASKKFMESSVLTVFSHGSTTREEYLLLRLIKSAVEFEIQSIGNMGDLSRTSPIFISLVLAYNRGAKEVQYLQSTFGPVVSTVAADSTEVDIDPVNVYKNIIKKEESATGERSKKKYDVTKEEALADTETRTCLDTNIAKIQVLTKSLVESVYQSLPRMPYGIRYMARELRRTLRDKFPKESNDAILRAVGNIIAYRYFLPIIVTPQLYDVTKEAVSMAHVKTLTNVANILNSISVGRTYSEADSHLAPLNGFVTTEAAKWLKFINSVTDIKSAEEHLNVDEYTDISKTKSPTIYISPTEIFSVHKALATELSRIAPEKDDPLRKIIEQLGDVPPFDAERTSQDSTITLQLTHRYLGSKVNEDVEMRKLFVETKRLLVQLIRVQNGQNLAEVLEKPVTEKDEELFQEFCASEDQQDGLSQYKSTVSINRGSDAGLRSPSPTTEAAPIHSLADLKALTRSNLELLEKQGRVKKADHYQDILSAIVKDIRDRHRRRQQRQMEKHNVEQTLKTLTEKHKYLQEQEASYGEYISMCVNNLTNASKTKKKSVLPFTQQFFHMRELQKQGKAPQFGSYKYTAKQLYDKGVLTSIDVEDFPVKNYDRVNITISSNQQGIFDVEATFAVGVVNFGTEKDQLKLEDLLSHQFENKNHIKLFDNAVTVNVNLLVFLINKKFYA